MSEQNSLVSNAFQTFMSEAPEHAQAWGGELLLDVAWPFASAVETRSGDPRVHFSASYGF